MKTGMNVCQSTKYFGVLASNKCTVEGTWSTLSAQSSRQFVESDVHRFCSSDLVSLVPQIFKFIKCSVILFLPFYSRQNFDMRSNPVSVCHKNSVWLSKTELFCNLRSDRLLPRLVVGVRVLGITVTEK